MLEIIFWTLLLYVEQSHPCLYQDEVELLIILIHHQKERRIEIDFGNVEHKSAMKTPTTLCCSSVSSCCRRCPLKVFYISLIQDTSPRTDTFALVVYSHWSGGNGCAQQIFALHNITVASRKFHCVWGENSRSLLVFPSRPMSMRVYFSERQDKSRGRLLRNVRSSATGLRSKIEYHRNKFNYLNEPIKLGGVEVDKLAYRICLFLGEKGSFIKV